MENFDRIYKKVCTSFPIAIYGHRRGWDWAVNRRDKSEAGDEREHYGRGGAQRDTWKEK